MHRVSGQSRVPAPPARITPFIFSSLPSLPLRESEIFDRIDNTLLLGVAELVVKRQSQQAIAEAFGDRAIAGLSTKLFAHVRQIQRQIMENAEDAARLEVRDQRRPR